MLQFHPGWLGFVPAFWCMVAFGQPAPTEPKPVLGQGEVTGNDVYVRSGSSAAHYEVCKLQKGVQVSIVGEEGDWYEILPPDGAFSLVAGEFVDTTDHQNGVINGDNVRVRAGSSLRSDKYEIQTYLNKGDQVMILGANADTFLRIKPPAGSTLWINRQFVRRPGETIDAPPAAATDSVRSSAAAVPSEKSEAGPQTIPLVGVVRSSAEPGALPAASTASGGTANALKVPFSDPALPAHRKELTEIDSAARSELARPVVDRNWAPIIERFQVIANLGPDELSRTYAGHRLQQLNDLEQITKTVRDLRSLDELSGNERREFLAKRASLASVSPTTAPRGMDAKGELRNSALYPPGSYPRRYRLLDTSVPTARTIAYVEIPQDSTINVDMYVGKYVGVRASDSRLQAGGVDSIPVLVAEELVLLQPPLGLQKGASIITTDDKPVITTSHAEAVSASASPSVPAGPSSTSEVPATEAGKGNSIPMITFDQPK